MILPCITLHMPWAYWVYMGWKTIETREHQRFACLNGKTIGIHASKTWDPNAMNVFGVGTYLTKAYLTAEQRSLTTRINPEEYFGRILCTAFCDGFRKLDAADAPLAMIECATPRWGNILTDPKPFSPFIKTRGYQGIWMMEVPPIAA